MYEGTEICVRDYPWDSAENPKGGKSAQNKKRRLVRLTPAWILSFVGIGLIVGACSHIL